MKISKLSFIRGIFVYKWEMGNPYTFKTYDITAFKDRKSHVKPVKNLVISQLSPPISHFPFPISRFPFPRPKTQPKLLPR